MFHKTHIKFNYIPLQEVVDHMSMQVRKPRLAINNISPMTPNDETSHANAIIQFLFLFCIFANNCNN